MFTPNPHRLAAALLVAAVLSLGLGGRADAAFLSGSMAFGEAGYPSASPSIGGSTDINSATSFTFGSLKVTAASGDFSALAGTAVNTPISLTSAFDAASPFTLMTTLGTFTETGIVATGTGSATTQAFNVVGTFTPTASGSVAEAGAVLTVSFTQTGGPGGLISDSATLTVPGASPAAVPEPSSLALCGVAGVVGSCRRRARRARAA